jgi:preprotein translocase subunit SecB
VEGNRHGSQITLNHNISALEGRNDAFGVEITISLDESSSENPPYFFTVSAFGIIALEKDIDSLEKNDKQQIDIMATQILVGSIRERLTSMTSRAPWSGFTLGIIPIKPQKQ